MLYYYYKVTEYHILPWTVCGDLWRFAVFSQT